MKILSLLKKVPIDLGQGNLRRTTKGKLIAQALIPRARAGMTALDVGCREGHQTRYLRKKGYNVTSIDIEKIVPECIVMDANKKLKFEDNSFDLIWGSEIIEHLDNPAFSISEFKRVLKPGGRLILTTPNSYFCLVRVAYILFNLSPRKIQRKDHKHYFNIQNIKQLFPHGRIYGFFPYLLLKFKIKRLVGLLSPTFVILDKK
ncbi:class I SAM-dependent methyltransferase [Candidatus Woesearchaeota archaeon]|nr:class I SAM-dependent methyltransferase [Candidatus Woesearchaeota archaeon]